MNAQAKTGLTAKEAAIWFLGAAGWIISYIYFAKWLGDNDWSVLGGWVQGFTASSDFTLGFLYDLVLVTVMMVALAIFDRRRLGLRWTIAVIASLALSVSISLAIYLVRIGRTE